VALLIQRLGIIVRDAAATILRQEARVDISKRIMHKLPEVPYPLFENNAFQARYGLVIREVSEKSISLVDALFLTLPILFGLVDLAVTMIACIRMGRWEEGVCWFIGCLLLPAACRTHVQRLGARPHA
jgi:hypothetical protein